MEPGAVSGQNHHVMRIHALLLLAAAALPAAMAAEAQQMQEADSGGLIGEGAPQGALAAEGGFVVQAAQVAEQAEQAGAAYGQGGSGSAAAPAFGYVEAAPEAQNDPSSSAQAQSGGSLEGCKNELAQVLYRAGFRGDKLREAWAIAMRESGGQADIGPGNPHFNGSDWGLFQFNKPSWGHVSWWDDKKMLDADYNASIAFKISKGGSYWLPWGLTGDGKPNGALYKNAGWTDAQIQAWIVEPFDRYYAQFGSLSAACHG